MWGNIQERDTALTVLRKLRPFVSFEKCAYMMPGLTEHTLSNGDRERIVNCLNDAVLPNYDKLIAKLDEADRRAKRRRKKKNH